MVPRLAGLALIFAATLTSAQAATVRIEFKGEKQREVWIQDSASAGEVPERTPSSGKAIEIEAPADTKGMTVFVRDVATGNVATKPLDQVVKAGRWTVEEKDETHTYSMVFLVSHDGKPVTSAVLKLKAGDEERRTLLTPRDMGMAGFLVVPYGDVQLTVEYESDGEDRALPPQTFESKPDMAAAGPIAVAISDDVETAQPQEPKDERKEEREAGSEPAEDEPSTTSPFSTVFNMLVGLAVIGGLSYAVWRYVKANPEKTGAALSQAGVPMPGDPAAPAAAPKKTGPPQQILLGDAPDPDPGATAAAAPAVKNPRLVAADGSLYIVQDGDQTVGRDAANALPLPSESSVSRTHARLSRTGDAVTLEDAGSTNGTFVNGQRLDGATQLRPGDTVQFGGAQYRYEE